MLDTDTATVLLVDDDTGELVTAAVSGTDDDIRLGLRLAPGEGFAGRVAVEGRPVIIDDVATSELRSSTLRSRGLRTLLGVPLLAGSQVTGVLHIGSTRPRRFGPDDVHLLRLVAERAALAIETRRPNVARAAAAALARSLIPSQPPAVPGLDISGRYLPAGEGGVGGDWYDILPLPSARVGIAIGDVVGRGLPAAVVMGRLRSALRAYALESSDPAEVLVRLDRKLQHFEAGQMTTVLYGVFDPSLQTIAVSSAGHPLPMAVTEHGEACSLDVPVDPPLGVAPALARRVTTVDVPLGS